MASLDPTSSDPSSPTDDSQVKPMTSDDSLAEDGTASDGMVVAAVVDESDLAQSQESASSTLAESDQDLQSDPTTETPPAPIRQLPHWVRDSLSWLTSLAVHMAILLSLGLWILEPEETTVPPNLVSIPSPLDEPIETDEIDPEPIESVEIEPESEIAEVPQPKTENIEEETEFSLVDDLDSAAIKVELTELSDSSAEKSNLALQVGAHQGSGLSGRGKASRSKRLRDGGGTPGSEAAVARALKWIATHQSPDGSWNFDHRGGVCQGRCRNEGRFSPTSHAHNGSTALALLTFLGAGQTHKEGQYQDTVYKGIYYLLSSMKVTANGGSLTDPGGRMYSHGLAAIALSEAYAMTQDPELREPAQLALNYIMYAQDPLGGGWRYTARKPGDTSVVGWQIMALKSGSMAYLNIDRNVIKKAYQFLDSVQSDSGASYGYTTPGRGTGTTAVGLLCRMYMGWDQENPALIRGVNAMAGRGPMLNALNSRPDNLYFNYYATQVIFQQTSGKGPKWKKWNTAMRDTLIKTQAMKGHETGSWIMVGGHGPDRGGRLYCTTMATMILEIYYRHMPIFQNAATEQDFPE